MIINSKIILISPQGNRSYVIEEHTTDDGKVYRVEGLRSNALNFEEEMTKRVFQVEETLARELLDKEEQDNALSAESKISAYLKTKDLKVDVGLIDDEIKYVK